MTQPAAGSPVRGIVCMVVGTLVLTCQDAVSKWLLDHLHAGEIMGWRALMSLPLVLLLLRLEGDSLRTLRSTALGLSLLRGFFALIASILVILSFKVLPLADALAIIFISPLMITALSAILLKEHVGWRRWTATCTGFVGVLLIVGPGFETVGIWALAPVGAALASALRDIATRVVSRHDPGPSVLFWTMVVGGAGGFATFPVMGASIPSAAVWCLLLACAVLLTLAFRLNIAAYKLASGAIVAPFRYLALVWAVAIGYVVWDDVPNGQMILGSAIVTGAGLYVWWREYRHARRGENAA
jgi:drug/metabolite transporter (DMT)-like permease